MDVIKEIDLGVILGILSYAEDRKLPLLIGSDTNSHTTLTGTDTNKRGTALEEVIIEHGLMIENMGKSPTYEVTRGDKTIQTCIDVTMSRHLEGRVSSWTVDRKIITDHTITP